MKLESSTEFSETYSETYFFTSSDGRETREFKVLLTLPKQTTLFSSTVGISLYNGPLSQTLEVAVLNSVCGDFETRKEAAFMQISQFLQFLNLFSNASKEETVHDLKKTLFNDLKD